MGPARVLLVDDDLLFVRRAQAVFGGSVELCVVDNHRDALAAAAEWQPDVVVLDALLSDVDAFRLLDEIRSRCARTLLGVICLVMGPCAVTYCQSGHGGFFGVFQRDAGLEALRDVLALALDSGPFAMACPA